MLVVTPRFYEVVAFIIVVLAVDYDDYDVPRKRAVLVA